MSIKGRCTAINYIEEDVVLTILPERLGVCRFKNEMPYPDWLIKSGTFFSLTKTVDETSIVCREELIPADYPSEKGFRAFKVQGLLDFNVVGILASLLNPLAADGITVFVISTYDTDYILVKQENLEKAIRALGTVATIIRET